MLYGENDDMTVGAHTALVAAHKDKQVYVVSMNGAPYGIPGIKAGWIEGLEVNLLGLVAGLDLRHPAIKLPGFGRIGVEPPVATALAN